MTAMAISLSELISYVNEENMRTLLEQYRGLGPLPGVLITFMKSFIPPLPTALVVGLNAAVYGLFWGFVYSWIGIVSGCVTTFLIVRRVAGHRALNRWSQKPKVQRSMIWVRRNAFSYVFILSMFPMGPFVLVNMAAAAAQMRLRSFFIAIAVGKAVMVLSVSIIGHDLSRFIERPYELIYVALFLGFSVWLSNRIGKHFTEAEVEAGGAAGPQTDIPNR